MKKYILILVCGFLIQGVVGCKKSTDNQSSKLIMDDTELQGMIGVPPPDDRDSIIPDSRKTYSQNHVFEVIEEYPSFPGGEKAMCEFLTINLKYPKIFSEANIQGRVICRFVVEKYGSITDIKVVRGIHELLDNEAVRVIKLMPKWIPGKMDGKPVRTWYTLPISFKLK